MALFVNGERVKKSDIKEEAERMRPHYQDVFRDQSPDEQEKQLWEWSRENVIERIILKQEARKDKRPISEEKFEDAFKKLLEDNGGKEKFYKDFNVTPAKEKKIKADLELQLRVERLLKDVCQNIKPPSANEVKKYFVKNKDKYKIPEQVRAAHIVKYVNEQVSTVKAYNDIIKIQKELKAGTDFEELADKKSDCPGKGGDLGYFPRGEMVQEFEDVVFSLGIGEVSDIIRSGFGYHLAKVYDKRPAKSIEFEHVKNEIVKKLIEEKREKRIDEYIDVLKEKAKIIEK